MGKRIAILQSNYIPWKGYFDLVNSVNEFIFYDDMQYTSEDWRNRNRIKTREGLAWLSIPVEKKGKLRKKISDVQITDRRWAKKHWSTLRQTYARADFIKSYSGLFESLYLEHCAALDYLSDINFLFISEINRILGIHTTLRKSSEFQLLEEKNERLVGICKDTGATTYLSGPAARDYLDVDLFMQEGILVEWMDYGGYPAYQQLYGPFEHGVTILDLIFNTGPHAAGYMKSFQNESVSQSA